MIHQSSYQWAYFNLILVFNIFLLKGVTSTTLPSRTMPLHSVARHTPGGSSSPLSQTGFELGNGATSTPVTAPMGWVGRMWARTGCATDASGRFSCETGDCSTGVVSCNGAGGAPPVTLLEFTLQGDGGKDFYDTSLVDGFNLRRLFPSKEGRATARHLVALLTSTHVVLHNCSSRMVAEPS
ncbi:thaumatin-like protein 1b [Iris pallida]|uniref:Thaumatin-like protein 1b n=1 Tax=Iris pallida TaxID=29817 RepID=A0AAX6I8H9_IRIPA|nr:thaumatin-like protein 1b [Iris pallida]